MPEFPPMTTANKITILRILLIPFFVVQVLYYERSGEEWHRLAALITFAVAAICDGVDGYIARHYHQISELGKILDPLADKLLLVSGVVLLTLNDEPHLQRLPLWLGATIISRDLLVLVGLVVIHMVCGKVVIRPRISGKIATVMQMTVVLWALLKWERDWLDIWVLGAALFTGLSGLLYLVDGVRQLSAHPMSSPTSRKSADSEN